MKTLAPRESGASRAAAPDPDLAWGTLFWLGLGAAILGFSDIAMNFYPSHWSNLDWEYGTISASMDSFPLATIGMGMALVAAIAKGWPKVRSVLGWTELAIGLLIAVMAVVLLLDIPVLLRTVDPAAKPVLNRALSKTFTEAITLIAVYTVVGLRAVAGARTKRSS